MISVAWAQDGGGATPPAILQLLPLLMMVGIFYVLLILPDQRRRKQHKELLAQLKRNDRITLASGIHGRVVGLDGDTLMVEIAPKVQVKVDRSAVQHVEGAEEREKERAKS
jgi:preprotein translocase subunit YajC